MAPLDPERPDGGEIGWPRVAAECQYSGSARFEDELEVDVHVQRIGASSVTYDFRFRVDDREIAHGSLTTVCCRLAPGRPAGIDAHSRATSSAAGGFPAAVNSPLTYLHSLTMRLAAGMEHVPAEVRARHGDFLKVAQQPDGGFAGRQGESDLYYTSFALRGLAILGELYGAVAERAADFLRARLDRPRHVDRSHVARVRRRPARCGGGDRRVGRGRARLEAVAGRRTPRPALSGRRVCQRLGRHRQQHLPHVSRTAVPAIDRSPDRRPGRNCPLHPVRSKRTCGGFREIRVSKRAGTNPTAAAIGVLRMLDALETDVAESTAEFLAEMQDDDGGLLANSRIPLADLLSTFTGVLTLADLDRTDALDMACRAGVRAVARSPGGGFRAALWDEVRDVEYTFYGLGSLALL